MTSFSNHRIQDQRDYLECVGGTPGDRDTENAPLLRETRALTYRFFPHFHPYLEALNDRLVRYSVAGLQATDTLYQFGDASADKKAETYKTIAASTTLTLMENTTAYDGDGNPLLLRAGSIVRLRSESRAVIPRDTLVADGATLKQLEVNKEVHLPGQVLVDGPGFLRVKEVDGAVIDLVRNTELFLWARTEAERTDGRRITISPGSASEPVRLRLTVAKPLPVLYEAIFSDKQYAPSDLVDGRWPVKELEFQSSGAYSVYNWELFFHVPLTVAVHLSKNQRFAQAQKWFHYIFDPTDDSSQRTPDRFWKVRPFQYTDVRQITDILHNLTSGFDSQLQEDTINSIRSWANHPFRPHIVARYRPTAFMYKVVMAYLDNLIAWGDTLFRQDTGESINEATQLYVLAANILGPCPQEVPRKGRVRTQTYEKLRAGRLDELGNALRTLEGDAPFDIVNPANMAIASNQSNSVRIGETLYFCVPRNQKLLGYWDTVADRLFKIRNSLNIQGTFRQLPLFEPPIDPGLLAKAAAAGVDVGSIISGANQPLPLVRFRFLVQKAAEICQEVKTLGNQLLSVMEKGDGEALAKLRAAHEGMVLKLAESVKAAQLKEAEKAREGIEISFENAVRRYKYFERLLGASDSDLVDKSLRLGPVSRSKETGALEEVPAEPRVEPREVDVDIASGQAKVSARVNVSFAGTTIPIVDAIMDFGDVTGGKKLNEAEVDEMALLEAAQFIKDAVAVIEFVGSALNLIPIGEVDGKPFGVGVGVGFGGMNLASIEKMLAAAGSALADRVGFEAKRAGMMAAYDRREQKWKLESSAAAGEINRIYKSWRAAQISEVIAEQEVDNHEKKIQLAADIEGFLRGDPTTAGTETYQKQGTQAFYAWMKREMKGLYAENFQFAFDIAKKAERALQQELGNPSLQFMEYGYLDGKEGLLAGEKLYLDIKRMEMAYHELNQREYELTKHVSLLQVSPISLLQLRETGRCTLALSEEVFDMDGPGHYFRRIKSAALSIPCVTGPYATLGCKLTLLKSSIRKTANLKDGRYARDEEDDRFSDYYGSMQSIVASSGKHDSGLFESSLNDERYLPFEGSGVVSEWQLELPANPSKDEPCQFDYGTISDVILHLRYTAREGGTRLRNAAMEHLSKQIQAAKAAGSVRLFSVRHEFPAEWSSFTASEGPWIPLEIGLRKQHFPIWSKGKPADDDEAMITLVCDASEEIEVGLHGQSTTRFVQDPSLGRLRVATVSGDAFEEERRQGERVDVLRLDFSDNAMQNLWLAVPCAG